MTLTIYDIIGREIKTVVNASQEAGYQSVIWDGTGDFGEPVSTGVYLYRIQAGEFVQTKKLLLLR